MKHVERIKALLRLARCSTASPAEAALALQRAMELIQKHQIDISELDLDAEAENFVRQSVHVGARLSQAKLLVGNLVSTFFNVRLCLSGSAKIVAWRRVIDREIVFMGAESDVQIALYAFDFLVRTQSKAASAYAEEEKRQRRRMTPRKREGFLQGWVYGVASNLKKPTENAVLGAGKAIILDRRRTALTCYAEEQFPGSQPIERKKERNESAMDRGWVAGKQTTVTTPLNNGPEQLTLC